MQILHVFFSWRYWPGKVHMKKMQHQLPAPGCSAGMSSVCDYKCRCCCLHAFVPFCSSPSIQQESQLALCFMKYLAGRKMGANAAQATLKQPGEMRRRLVLLFSCLISFFFFFFALKMSGKKINSIDIFYVPEDDVVPTFFPSVCLILHGWRRMIQRWPKEEEFVF